MSESGLSERELDYKLVKRVQSGDRRAFDLLVSKYQYKLLALAKRFVRDEDVALDIVQDAFVKAYKALKGFRGDSAFYTWMYRIAINTAKNYLSAKLRRPPEQDIEAIDAERLDVGGALRNLETPEEALHVQQLEKMLQQTLARLPAELREAVTLREYDGLSYEEIAKIMACPIGTVRSRIFRAREALENTVKNLSSGENVQAHDQIKQP